MEGVCVPTHLVGPVYHEYCDCPEEDAEEWQAALDCPAGDPQVEADFVSFPSIDLVRLREEVPRRFAQRGGLIHYTILNNQLHRRTQGRYTDFKMFSDEMLQSLMRKVSGDCMSQGCRKLFLLSKNENASGLM